MLDPPTRGVESNECVDLYEHEMNGVFSGLKERAKMLEEAFNKMTNITCNEIEGSMYGFP